MQGTSRADGPCGSARWLPRTCEGPMGRLAMRTAQWHRPSSVGRCMCACAHARRLAGKTRACKARAGQTAHVARPNGSLALARGRRVGSRCEPPSGTAHAATPPSVRSTCASVVSRDARVRESRCASARVRECAIARCAQVRSLGGCAPRAWFDVRTTHEGHNRPCCPSSGLSGLDMLEEGPPVGRRFLAVGLEQRESGSFKEPFASWALRGFASRAV